MKHPVLILLFAVLYLQPGLTAMAGQSSPVHTPSTLSFTENKGQWRPSMLYMAELASGKLMFEKNHFSFLLWDGEAMNEVHHSLQIESIKAHYFKVNFVQSNPAVETEGFAKESNYRNYFTGNNPDQWATEVSVYKKIVYRNLWAGIDARFFGTGDALKYEFIVNPHASLSVIRLQYEGADELKIKDGELHYKTSVGTFRELAPFAYQMINGTMKQVKCDFVLDELTQTVSFSFPQGYDAQFELTIDPTIVFSTYTGATSDNWGYTATYDNQENMYVGGFVNATDLGSSYPTTPGAFQITWGGGTGGNNGNGNGITFSCDMGISKFSADGRQLIYSTYLGGSDNETPHSLVVDNSGNLVVYGVSYSINYPVSGGAFDVSHNGLGDIVVTKFNAAGTALIGSTFIGGAGEDGYNFNPHPTISGNLKRNYGDQNRGEVIVDAQGNIYVASCTRSNNFPVSGSAPQRNLAGSQDGCIFKLSANCQTLFYSTYVGGANDDACYSLDLTASNEVYVCGGTMSTNFPTTTGAMHTATRGGMYDGFILRLNTSGTQFLQSTYIGTSGNDQVYFVKLDGRGDVYFVGQTTGAYPVVNAAYSNPNSGQFIGKINPTLGFHIYSTVFGSGSGVPNISPTAFLVDTCENVYVSGWGTNSSTFSGFLNNMSNMPLSADAAQRTTDGTDFYFFVLKKDAQSLLYASYFGGNGGEEHVDGGTSRFDKRGVIYQAICAGCGRNSLTPTTPGVWSPTNGSRSNCNLLALKIAFNLAGTFVQVDAFPRATGCVPLTVQFRSTGSTTQNLTWNFDDGTTSTQANPLHTFTDTGVYRVMLVGFDSTSCNTHDTAYIEVEVRDDSLVADFLPYLQVNCDSNQALMRTLSYPSASYLWNMGDGTFYSTDSVNHRYQNPGSYNITLIVTDTTRCNLRDTFNSQILIPPPLDATFNTSSNGGCIPHTVNFNITSSPTALYSWDFGDGATATTASVLHTYLTPGTFQVSLIVIDSASCNVSDTAYTTIVTIDSSSNADFILVRTFYGCDSVLVTLRSPYVGEDAELWDFGDGTQIANMDSVSHVYNTAGTFTITHYITDADKICKPLDTAQVVISLQPLDISVTIPDSGGCLPFTTQFIGSSTLLTTDYYWSFGDGNFAQGDSVSHTFNGAGVFLVSVAGVDTNACVGADSAYAQITVINDSVTADFQINVLNDCDSSLIIELNNQSINAVSYFWDFGDGNTSTQQNEGHTYTVPGTYLVTLIVTDTNRCHPVDTVSSTVTLLPNLSVEFAVQNVCLGSAVQFNNLSNPAAEFVWNFGDGDFSNLYSPAHNYADDGTYTVGLIIIDSSTCDVRDTIYRDVIVYEQPIADFHVSPDSFRFETLVEFTNQSRFYTDLFWDFGDGSTEQNEEYPYRIYESIGWKTVCLTASNEVCLDTICKRIFISFETLIGVPNAFSPNGDGVNDVVKIEGKGIVELTFRIFNRWGEKVFETNNKEIGWDGFYKGTLQEMEVYTYSAEAVMINGDVKLLKGNITLLR